MNKIENSFLTAQIIPPKLTYNIRKKVLWPHIQNNDYTIKEDKDPNTFHIGVFFEKNVISVGTFIQENNPKLKSENQYRLRAMGTDILYQKMGAGKQLIRKSIELFKKRGIDVLWCSSRLNAIPFYASLNMKSLNEIYHIVNIGPHKTMYLYIKQ